MAHLSLPLLPFPTLSQNAVLVSFHVRPAARAFAPGANSSFPAERASERASHADGSSCRRMMEQLFRRVHSVSTPSQNAGHEDRESYREENRLILYSPSHLSVDHSNVICRNTSSLHVTRVALKNTIAPPKLPQRGDSGAEKPRLATTRY